MATDTSNRFTELARDPDHHLAFTGLGGGQVVQAWRGAGVGSRMDFVADLLGGKLAYTHEIAELEPNDRVVMRTAGGLFPMEPPRPGGRGATAEPG